MVQKPSPLKKVRHIELLNILNSTKKFKGNLERDFLEHLRIGEKKKERKTTKYPVKYTE